LQESINPYRAPASEVEESELIVLVPASRWRRFSTLVVDSLCRGAFFLVVLLIAARFFGGLEFYAQMGRWGRLGLGLCSALVYYMAFEGLFARTPGKWVCGTVVVDERGGRPSFGQILGRTACRMIPFEPLSFFGEKGVGWHDTLPRTLVVRVTPRG
jgi:uncharacterized RDD family membrane protein YckC